MANLEYFSDEDVISFTLLDAHTVERLQRDGDIKLPRKKVDIPKDERWNTKQMSSKLLQGILAGDDISTIAKSLMQVIGNNAASAVRNARTMVTGAENVGRLDSYEDLAEKGVVQKKVWIATADDRTRESHLLLDGEEVDIDKPFSNGLMYPADPSGDPSEVYNCRCSMRDHIVGFRRADGTISLVGAERDTTSHAGKIEEEIAQRGLERVAEAPAVIDLSDVNLPEFIVDSAIEYSERMSQDDIEKFNEIFKDAEYVESENGSYYDPASNEIYVSQSEASNTTAFHESTHWYDYNQNYTITEDWGRYARDENGRRTDEWIPNISVLKENAGFSEYIAHEWGYYERGSDTNLQMLDMKNFVEKVGTSDTYGWGRDAELVQQDMKAINAYLDSMGVSRSDPDYVHLSDFISAISYDANLGSLATGGHSYDYWVRGDEHRVTEITAGYNLLRATGREDLIAVERDLAPNLMKLIETEWAKIW